MEQPETRYARTGDISIAYQVGPENGPDLLIVPGLVSHVELGWANPLEARLRERFAAFSRLIIFDKRGTGLSDPVDALMSIEERMDDVRAVLDAATSQRATLVGFSEGGPIAAMFAATHPDRVERLIMYGTFARALQAEDYPDGLDDTTLAFYRKFFDEWPCDDFLDWYAPSLAGDPRNKELFRRYASAVASPRMVRELWRWIESIDIRPVLSTIRVPTLVLHRRDELIPSALGRYLAEHIANAKYVELAGRDHVMFAGDAARLVDEIEEFVTGQRGGSDEGRVLATVLFTDIVESTKTASKLGDDVWRSLLSAHDDLVRRQVERFQGRLVKTLGDGALALFDRPTRGLRCADAIVDAAARLGLPVRAGLHTGECELFDDDVAGLAVHIAARVCSLAGSREVLLSSTVRDLVVGAGFEFTDRGRQQLRGVPGEWAVAALVR